MSYPPTNVAAVDMVVMVLVGVAIGGGVALALIRARDRAGEATTAGREEIVADELSSVRDEMRRLTERLGQDSSILNSRLEGIDSRMTETHVANSSLATNIFDTLGDVRRATTMVADQAREFSSLQDLLKAPKARGGIGEAMLEELLRQVLPPQAYRCQHRFSSGAIVDATVKAGGRIVCIDSKFPLSNYRRICEATDETERLDAERCFAGDVERHIQDISSRYIVPDENTFDFAVMYVPAEGVYSEVLRLAHRRRPLFETAIESRVVPMSPLTLYGYLQTILFGLKCLRIEESAEAILDFCGRLQRDMERFATEYEVLGKHLGNARGKFEEGTRRLDRFRDKLERVVDLAEDGAEAPVELDRPPLEVVND